MVLSSSAPITEAEYPELYKSTASSPPDACKQWFPETQQKYAPQNGLLKVGFNLNVAN
jgi:hypothetical protein